MDILLSHVDHLLVLFTSDETEATRMKSEIAAMSLGSVRDRLEEKGASIVRTQSSNQVGLQ